LCATKALVLIEKARYFQIMNIFRMSLLVLAIVSASAWAGDEVRNGRVAPGKEKSEDQFCMIDPTTKEEVCVEKSKKDELKKKLEKKNLPAPAAPDQPEK
jgi:hypothetical protein